jgi:nucleoside-diphosphate-sugar epimerase
MSQIQQSVEALAQLSNTPGLTDLSKTEIVWGDLNDRVQMQSAVQDCQAVLHSAGLIHVKKLQDWFKVNTEGTKTLFEAAAEASVENFVYLSSNAAGGRGQPGSLMSEDQAPSPQSDYGRSKLEAENYILKSSKTISRVILRPCMFYGNPVPSRHVEIFKRIQSSWMPMIGAHLPRSMVHVNNLTDACFLALQARFKEGRIFYVADARPYSIEEYVNTIAELLEVHPKKLYLPNIISVTAHYVDKALNQLGLYNQNIHLLGESSWSVGVDISRARQELGYKPRYNLRQGLEDSISGAKRLGLL